MVAAEVSIVILSGGGDVGDDPERDFTERGLLEYARVNRLPLLGICRGMQVMGVNAGGKLIRVARHVGGRHQISGEMTGEVNSFHEKALSSCPPDYRETSRSEDGVLEAIRHRILPWEGWMWHPEREDPFAVVWINKFRDLAA
jgi:putative glutamine amidotransferase